MAFAIFCLRGFFHLCALKPRYCGRCGMTYSYSSIECQFDRCLLPGTGVMPVCGLVRGVVPEWVFTCMMIFYIFILFFT